MWDHVVAHVPDSIPPEAYQIALVLAISLFVGLEREEHKQREQHYAFGGVRTFPLIGLVSYALALLPGGVVAWAIGLAVVGALMGLSYSHKLRAGPDAGVTTEISALVTYAIGGLVHAHMYWIATTLAVVSVLLLELKMRLEGLTRYIAAEEIITVAKFLVLAVVILPILPDRALTPFQINPFSTWVVVVAVSGVSFASYVAQRVLGDRGGLLATALLGGAYSSTVTTVVLARQARQGGAAPSRYAGAITMASAVMYVRLVVLVALFDRVLGGVLAPPFLALAAVGAAAGAFVYTRGAGGEPATRTPRNPLALQTAVVFAVIFVGVQIATRLVTEHLGKAGIFALAAIMGISDVDPFILGLTQASTRAVSLPTAAIAIVIAAASNDLVKAIYAYAFARGPTGRRSLALLLAFAALGLVPLAWLAG